MMTDAYGTATLQEHQNALFSLLKEFDRVCRELSIPYILFAGTLLGAVRHKGFIPWDDDLDVMMLREDYERFIREADRILDREGFYLQREFSENWPMFFSKLRLNHTTCLEKYHPKNPNHHQGVYMDIFPCDHAAGSALGRRIQFYASKVVIAKSLDKRGYETDSTKKKLFIRICRLLPMKPFLAIVVSGGNRNGALLHSFLGGASRYTKNIYPRHFFEKRTELPFESGFFYVPEDYDGLLRILYNDYLQLPPEEERAVKQHAVLIDLNRSYEEYADYRNGMKFDVHTRSIR